MRLLSMYLALQTKKNPLTIHCNFQMCFSCQKAAGGVETRPHTVHGDSSVTTVSYIRGFFNSFETCIGFV